LTEDIFSLNYCFLLVILLRYKRLDSFLRKLAPVLDTIIAYSLVKTTLLQVINIVKWGN